MRVEGQTELIVINNLRAKMMQLKIFFGENFQIINCVIIFIEV